MGKSALPDMYARSPRAEGIHIRQITSAHVTYNKYVTLPALLKSAYIYKVRTYMRIVLRL